MNHNGEAEDVLQDAFLDAFQKINDFQQTSTFGAWLKQIVINRVLNQLRNRKVQWVDIEEGYHERITSEKTNNIIRDLTYMVDNNKEVIKNNFYDLFILLGFHQKCLDEFVNITV